MADDPIIFDDGGSVRIKKLRNSASATSVGEMDGLLDVKEDVGNPASGRPGAQATPKARTSSYGSVTVVAINKDGSVQATGITGVAFDSIEVSTGATRIDGDLQPDAGTGFNNLRITVSAEADPPIVDAKQHKRQRRYVVTNTSPIERVTVRRSVGAPLVFNVPNTVVYTSVHVS